MPYRPDSAWKSCRSVEFTWGMRLDDVLSMYDVQLKSDYQDDWRRKIHPPHEERTTAWRKKERGSRKIRRSRTDSH